MIWTKRIFVALGGVLLAAALLGAVPPKREPSAERPSLAGEELESKAAHGAWLAAMADRTPIFDEKRERLWDAAWERRLRDL